MRSVLAALARLEPVSTRRLSRAVALPVPIVASVCGELRKRGVVADERPAQLTAAGRALFAAGELRLERRARCPSCAGRAVVIPPGLTRVVRAIARDAAQAPPPRLELDQCHCTVETKLRRVLAIHEAGALTGRRILFLGDDDLTSLALRRLVDEIGSESTIEHVGVVDIDPAIVAFVERRLASSGFPVSCLQHDLRSSLPRGWVGRIRHRRHRSALHGRRRARVPVTRRRGDRHLGWRRLLLVRLDATGSGSLGSAGDRSNGLRHREPRS